MIEYLIGVDGGGTGTRVRLADPNGAELAQASGGPSGLSHGIDKAWVTILAAIGEACAVADIGSPPLSSMAIGLGLAGVHNKDWAAQFVAADPGFAALVLDTDGFSTLMGAHGGQPGAIVAIGTGSVGEAMRLDGAKVEVGGWGFPAGDEASGAWMGLRALNHIEQVLDGRVADGPLARDVIAACGGNRDAVQIWLGRANQTAYAGLARFVVQHGDTDPVARAILEHAGREVASIADALDPGHTLPLALCGGLGEVLLAWLPPDTRARCLPPQGDSARGALLMIERHLERTR
ncbi:BadF/BadG/BcrA/BcrD ATPase family protein [Massilia sp. Leaf139]|uniref:BadF/BadG/BcrA/BcrD ATPase family protein n=1 Tax=Massilia sp. Leaf139 TaxID=1736272 RepID=UPI0006FDE5EB|nr:BadF/BadG/BcrA/BcrD ATPase family protein [Massilia sp. Leaf139]KQQ86813.1 ATPase [Massilia sp. Leaf139]